MEAVPANLESKQIHDEQSGPSNKASDSGTASTPKTKTPRRAKNTGMLKRVDNFFYNTRDVARLANFYSAVLGIPIRREQVESPGLMWAELSVGGMELSFRLAGGTPKAHPELKDFLEVAPGKGATVSFEVDNTEKVRAELQSRGVRFRDNGDDCIYCSLRQELISVFEDPFGRPVQLYEARFATVDEARVLAKRASATLAASGADAFSNLRDVRDLAMSTSFYVDDLKAARQFYGDVLELPIQGEDENRISFLIDGSVIEFRKRGSRLVRELRLPQLSSKDGAVVAFEVRSVESSLRTLQARGVKAQPVAATQLRNGDGRSEVGFGIAASGPLAVFRDQDRNLVELWERYPSI